MRTKVSILSLNRCTLYIRLCRLSTYWRHMSQHVKGSQKHYTVVEWRWCLWLESDMHTDRTIQRYQWDSRHTANTYKQHMWTSENDRRHRLGIYTDSANASMLGYTHVHSVWSLRITIICIYTNHIVVIYITQSLWWSNHRHIQRIIRLRTSLESHGSVHQPHSTGYPALILHTLMLALNWYLTGLWCTMTN